MRGATGLLREVMSSKKLSIDVICSVGCGEYLYKTLPFAELESLILATTISPNWGCGLVMRSSGYLFQQLILWNQKTQSL